MNPFAVWNELLKALLLVLLPGERGPTPLTNLIARRREWRRLAHERGSGAQSGRSGGTQR